MKNLTDMRAALARHRPLRLPGRRRLIRAAVAAVLADRPEGLSVLLVRRAERPGDPWSGDMALPGGRLAPDDAGGAAAACRETAEETGLRLAPEHRIGRLTDRITRAHRQPLPMVVSPFVFSYPERADDWRLNHEVEHAVWVPLAFLGEPRNRDRMYWRVAGPLAVPLPCYDFAGQRIWGLTLLMLDELVRVARRAGRNA